MKWLALAVASAATVTACQVQAGPSPVVVPVTTGAMLASSIATSAALAASRASVESEKKAKQTEDKCNKEKCK